MAFMKRKVLESEDWCHVCGQRGLRFVEIHYPKNAERETTCTQYLRICDVCVEKARNLKTGDGALLEALQNATITGKKLTR